MFFFMLNYVNKIKLKGIYKMIKKITLMTLLTTAIFTHIHATDDFPTEKDCKGQGNLTTVEKEHVKIGDSCAAAPAEIFI